MLNKKVFLVLGLLICIASSVMGAELFYDGFETGLGNWTNFDWYRSNDSAKEGTYSVVTVPFTSTAFISKTVDTSTEDEINVSWWFYDIGCDSNDIQIYFNDSGGNWDLIKQVSAVSLGSGNDVWNDTWINTSDAQYLHSGFSVRFYSNTFFSESYNIDEFFINSIDGGTPPDNDSRCDCPDDGGDWYIGGCENLESCDMTGGDLYINGTTTIPRNTIITGFKALLSEGTVRNYGILKN